ncbi:MAG: lytic transglycosylase domain-containing protein [Rhizobiales bacterium]|nr:lytic transglycosylase domain-containing protein [Hyphomicrobiales bacterium]
MDSRSIRSLFRPAASRTYDHLGPQIEKALVYAISRQESEFQPYVVSPANAYGLMQVIRPTGAGIARRLGIGFDFDQLQGDPVYNVTLGSAELGHLIQSFNGSYVLTFIGYNAGPGRSRQWMNARGDPAAVRPKRSSTGSSAFRSRKRGFISCACSKTCRSIARCSRKSASSKSRPISHAATARAWTVGRKKKKKKNLSKVPIK